MRIAVTGATGFVGQHLLARLRLTGHEVIAMIRDQSKAKPLMAQGVQLVFGDLTYPPPRTGRLEADMLVHLAGLSSNWGRRRDFMDANVTGTENALALAKQLGARRFIHISSPSIYFRLADQLDVTEDMPLPAPINAYAESKMRAEDVVMAATGIGKVILRPRGIYGPGDTSLLPRLVRAAERGPLPLLRGGQAVTDVTHVSDVVEAILAAIRANPALPPGAFNISGGEPVPVRVIAEAACEMVGVRVRWRRLPLEVAMAGVRVGETINRLRPGRPEPLATIYSLGLFAYSQTLDLSKARQLLGWEPRMSLADGLATL